MKNLIIILLAVSMMGCSATKIIGSWSRGEAPVEYKNVAILVMTPKASSRAITETAIADNLKAAGVNATHTLDIFPLAGNQDLLNSVTKEEIEAAINKKLTKYEVDAFMIVALLDREKEQQYVQGSSVGMGMPYGYGGYRGSYYGYYGYASGSVYSPGYYTTTTSYYIEANLYDVKSSQLIWTAQTKTTDPTNMESEAKNFARIIVDDIVRKQVFAGNE